MDPCIRTTVHISPSSDTKSDSLPSMNRSSNQNAPPHPLHVDRPQSYRSSLATSSISTSPPHKTLNTIPILHPSALLHIHTHPDALISLVRSLLGKLPTINISLFTRAPLTASSPLLVSSPDSQHPLELRPNLSTPPLPIPSPQPLTFSSIPSFFLVLPLPFLPPSPSPHRQRTFPTSPRPAGRARALPPHQQWRSAQPLPPLPAHPSSSSRLWDQKRPGKRPPP